MLFGKFRLPWNTESCRVLNFYSLFVHVKPSPFFWLNIQFLVILTTSSQWPWRTRSSWGSIRSGSSIAQLLGWSFWHDIDDTGRRQGATRGGFPRTISLDFWSTTMGNYYNSKDLTIRSHQKLPDVICSGHLRQRLEHSGLLPCSAVVNDWSENGVTASGKVEYCRTRFWNGWFFSILSGFCYPSCEPKIMCIAQTAPVSPSAARP